MINIKKLIGYIIEIISFAAIFKISSTGGFEYFDKRFWIVFIALIVHGVIRYLLGYFEGRRSGSARIMESILDSIEMDIQYCEEDL